MKIVKLRDVTDREKVRRGWCPVHVKPPINAKGECIDCHPEFEREEIWCPKCKRWTRKWGHEGVFICSHGDHIIRIMNMKDWDDVSKTPLGKGFPKDDFKAERCLGDK